MSKILFAVLAICLMSISSFAQQGINYKAIIKDDLGNVLNATFMNVQFTIHQGTTTGTIVYQENHNYTTDANGLIILNIGTDPSPNIGTFASINWSEDLHFLQTTITYNGGTINFDATEFMAVPYAKHAETAENVTGLETIEEGSGIGWRLIGQNPDNYGPIGNGAVDLSQSPNSATNGATGEYSTAMGNQTRASGDNSTAMGNKTRAYGDNSTAMGLSTSASGDNSTAIGRNTFASSENSLAIGWLNEDVPDALFMIGNGFYDGEFTISNALTVLKNGTITAPSFDIFEITDDKALITKEYLDNASISKIDDLSDAKSDNNSSSLYIGLDAGLNDNGASLMNVGIGFNAMQSNTTGYWNTAIGHRALFSNTTGRNNTASGNEALYANTTGNANSANGYRALADNTNGTGNTASGYSALRDNETGSENVAIGYEALMLNTEGNRNVAIGRYSGERNNGSNNVFIGNRTGNTSLENSSDNKLYINNDMSNNPLIYGEFDTDLIRIHGSFEVNDGSINRFKVLENGTITAPSFSISLINIAGDKALITKEYGDTRYLLVDDNGILDGPLTIENAADATSSWRLETRPNGGLSMYRNGNYRGYFSESTGNYSSISDRRTKKDITALENGTLNKLMQLNPVSYLMKDQTDTKRNLGLISQEVQEIFPSITTYVEESDLITLSYTELIPILIKALQEQQGVINTQNSKIETLSTDNSTLENTVINLISRVEKIETNNQ